MQLTCGQYYMFICLYNRILCANDATGICYVICRLVAVDEARRHVPQEDAATVFPNPYSARPQRALWKTQRRNHWIPAGRWR